ncbi:MULTISPECIES: hypothetical protein [Fischerella]|uniref:Uncharacterized protein n=1 Tax=Fischerella muscicola CCMEE 5323 TaxID=2019572 RepID=A0A2N6K0I1_FISMU|nr:MULTISPECIES: hypothetical protein [Fischerella]MBD2432213.1 hypothetical protein [Fischerella sp. FACHB-380]PLZ87573.1 hypothetical protein CEN44_17130 [Fischerella muscicola CCMEE 5323]
MQTTLKTFSQYLDLPQTQVESLLSKSLTECLNSPEQQQQLNSLDVNLLRETLPTAGAVLAKELPPFYSWLTKELGVERVPDSPDHTTKWVIGFVNNQESLTNLVELHRPVPRPALERAIPRLIELFVGVKDTQVRKEWQKAIAILCLPLVVDAREREKQKHSLAA